MRTGCRVSAACDVFARCFLLEDLLNGLFVHGRDRYADIESDPYIGGVVVADHDVCECGGEGHEEEEQLGGPREGAAVGAEPRKQRGEGRVP